MFKILPILVLTLITLYYTSELFSNRSINTYTTIEINVKRKIKIKRSRLPITYYSNSIATFNLVLSGDIEVNPGPGLPSPKCETCDKTVRINQKRVVCEKCYNFNHASCVNMLHLNIASRTPCHWTCSNCLHLSLPFSNQIDMELFETSVEDSLSDRYHDVHLDLLDNNKHLLKLLHINTQSLTSRFDEFLLAINKYNFDVVAMSETWLKDNRFLLDHVRITDYDLYYSNRTKAKGGGVGCYIRSSIKSKRRKDIENLDQELEHLWLQIDGRNKHSKLLMCVIYRSNKFLTYNEWLDRFEKLINKVKSISHLNLP